MVPEEFRNCGTCALLEEFSMSSQRKHNQRCNFEEIRLPNKEYCPGWRPNQKLVVHLLTEENKFCRKKIEELTMIKEMAHLLITAFAEENRDEIENLQYLLKAAINKIQSDDKTISLIQTLSGGMRELGSIIHQLQLEKAEIEKELAEERKRKALSIV